MISKKRAQEIAPLIYALQNCGSVEEQQHILKHLDSKGMNMVCDAVSLVIKDVKGSTMSAAKREKIKRLIGKKTQRLGFA